MARHSYLRYFETDTSDGDAGHSVPSALLWDGSFLFVPLYAVTSMSLSETYHLPPLGSRAAQAMVASQEDTISLSGVLVGVERFAWKLALELAADAAVRGSALASYSQGAIGGLALVTSMTIRTDMYIQSLSFSSTAAKRNAIDVSITLRHMPRPGSLAQLLDFASVAVSSLIVVPAYYQGGASAIFTIWFLLIPLMAGFLLGHRFAVLMGVIVLCLTLLPITALGLLVGISALLPAIAVTYFWRTMQAPGSSSGHSVTEARE